MLCVHGVFSTRSNVVVTICNLATRSLLCDSLPTHVLTHYTWFAVELQTLPSSMKQWLKKHHDPPQPIFTADNGEYDFNFDFTNYINACEPDLNCKVARILSRN
jgi:hypothetical protein